MRIGDLLRNKPSHDVITISPEASVRELIALLAEHNVGALIVSADGTSVDGIVSERDVVRRLVEHDEVLQGPVAAIMTESVETVDEQGLVDDLMKTMTQRRIRHVPVVTNGRLSGIISIGDIVKHRIDQLEFERDQLDHYVHGG
jgi:CBS domain-containing protein